MPYPPYINSTGLITKIFSKIAEAQQPERFTTDYLTNVIGHGSGSARPIIPLLKRLNFLQSDGKPTQLYARYGNQSERASAMLEALKVGYPELYARSEYAHILPREKLRDLIVEITGLKRDTSIVTAIVGTFEAIKIAGGVEKSTTSATPDGNSYASNVPAAAAQSRPESPDFGQSRNGQEVGMNLSYTINLNLPPTPNPEVFNAIFKALKEHPLGK